ncbi:hypothetical protein FQA39_LY02685 [Lamprigera yunnana]|nr:hypothetical protein FQA39_LY02685 [Lamprigera yunnana]
MEEICGLDHFSLLDVYQPVQPIALTGIICTIGPASRSIEVLESMIEAGMTIARLNLANETHEYHAETIENIKTAVVNYSYRIGIPHSVAIAVDTRGPEIRIGTVDRTGAEQVQLKKGDTIKLTIDQDYLFKGSNKIIYIDYPQIIKYVIRGTRVYLNSGSIALICSGVASTYINCVIEIAGILPCFADVRVPGVALDLPDVSHQDKLDLLFALKHDVKIVFVTYVRNAIGPLRMRDLLGRKGQDIVLVSKIEDLQAVKHFTEIMNASDAIMIIRELLGLEVPPEKMFLIQKSIGAKCIVAGKPVICATRPMEYMMERDKPSRLEIADVANAIVDGMDCVLLTDETERGENPVSSITNMIVICKEAEKVVWQKRLMLTLRDKVHTPMNTEEGVAISAIEAVEKCNAAAIVVLTTNGKSARLISKYRPQCPVVAITRNVSVIPLLLLYRSVLPLYFKGAEDDDWVTDVDVQINYGVKYGVSRGFIKASDMIIAVTTWKRGFDYNSTLSNGRSNVHEKTKKQQIKNPIPITWKLGIWNMRGPICYEPDEDANKKEKVQYWEKMQVVPNNNKEITIIVEDMSNRVETKAEDWNGVVRSYGKENAKLLLDFVTTTT